MSPVSIMPKAASGEFKRDIGVNIGLGRRSSE
jgi:hypothetical protein